MTFTQSKASVIQGICNSQCSTLFNQPYQTQDTFLPSWDEKGEDNTYGWNREALKYKADHPNRMQRGGERAHFNSSRPLPQLSHISLWNFDPNRTQGLSGTIVKQWQHPGIAITQEEVPSGGTAASGWALMHTKSSGWSRQRGPDNEQTWTAPEVFLKYLDPDRELEALRKKPENVESLLLKNLIHTQS